VGAATLIPWSTLFRSVNEGQTISALSEYYDVTTHLVEYRIKITGAYRLYSSRQRCPTSYNRGLPKVRALKPADNLRPRIGTITKSAPCCFRFH